MDDTPDHVKKLQLQIWLSKSPEERLRRAIEDNEALYAFWEEGKKQLDEQRQMARKGDDKNL